MTNEEAIKLMRSIRRTPANWILEYEAIDKAIKALEKQIPKKPNGETYFKNYSYQKTCPVCEDWLILSGGTKMKYCCNCGQAIDWSEQ